MPVQTAPRQDRTADLIPSTAAWRLREVEALPGWRLKVCFNDGLQGIVEMEREIHAPDAGLFGELAEPMLFAQVSIDFGAVTWPNGLDLAPDAMHAEIEANGRWIL